jgi:DNA-binding CsgD family transcriptional regulator
MPPRAATLPLLIVQGDWDEAHDLATVTRAQGSPLERHMAVTILGNLAWCRGDLALAWEMVRELLPRGPATEPGDSLFPYAIEVLRLAIRLALDEPNAATGWAWLRSHEHWLEWSGAVRGRAEAQLLRARLHRLEGDLPRSEQLAREALRLADDPRQPLVLLDAHRFLGRVFIKQRRFPDAEENLALALNLADACAAPYERALTLVRLAELRIACGQAGDARPLLDEAREVASRLGATPLVTMLDRLGTTAATSAETSGISAGLTAREIDVLRLVAEGLTDAEVAEKLYISPRTVGQHLRSVYNKLGVSSRTAATRLAVQDKLI